MNYVIHVLKNEIKTFCLDKKFLTRAMLLRGRMFEVALLSIHSCYKFSSRKCLDKNLGIKNYFMAVIFCSPCFYFRFHCYNGTRQSDTVPAGTQSQLADDELFARPPDARTPRVS